MSPGISLSNSYLLIYIFVIIDLNHYSLYEGANVDCMKLAVSKWLRIKESFKVMRLCSYSL